MLAHKKRQTTRVSALERSSGICSPIRLSEKAVRRLRGLLAGQRNSFFRVRVESGGCSGFQYVFSFCEETTTEDHTFVQDGIPVVVDKISCTFLQGSDIDFLEELSGAHFVVHNPLATSGCGCGVSFSV